MFRSSFWNMDTTFFFFLRSQREVCRMVMNWINTHHDHESWIILGARWNGERERDNKKTRERERESVLSRSSEAQPTEPVNANPSLLIAQHYQQRLNFKATWCTHSTPTDLEKEEKVVYALFPSRLSNASTAMYCAHVSNKTSLLMPPWMSLCTGKERSRFVFDSRKAKTVPTAQGPLPITEEYCVNGFPSRDICRGWAFYSGHLPSVYRMSRV